MGVHTTWSVVTGASGGIGEAFADYLAAAGQNLVLTGRRQDKLEELATTLQRRHRIDTNVLSLDLAVEKDREALVTHLAGLDLDTLVNNAGFGMLGEVATADADRLVEMVSVNCVALTQLTRAVLPGLLLRGRGSIINVASTAAFQPIPSMAAYAASKSYVLSFSQALWSEVNGTGVRVTAICPGPTDTRFFVEAGNDRVMTRRRQPAQVVASTFEALKDNKPYVVDGAINATVAKASKLAPARFAMRISRRMARG